MKTIASRLSAYHCPTAGLLYFHLTEMAARTGARRLTVKRRGLATALNVGSLKTITKALKVLRKARLLSYRARALVRPDGTYCGKSVRISLRRGALSDPSAVRFPQGNGALSGPSAKPNPIGKRGTDRPFLAVASEADNVSGFSAVTLPPGTANEARPATPEQLERMFGGRQKVTLSRQRISETGEA